MSRGFSEQKKADAVVDLLVNGLTWDAACEKHKCSKSTLSGWVAAWKKANKVTAEPRVRAPKPSDGASDYMIRSLEEAYSMQEARQRRMRDEVDETIIDGMRLVRRIANEIDGDLIRKDPAAAINLATLVFRRQDRFIDIICDSEEEETEEPGREPG